MTRQLLLALATSTALERAVRAVPGAEAAAYRRAQPYVAGRTREEALARARLLAADGLAVSIDLFGEGAIDPAEADRVADAYVALAGALAAGPANAWLSVDLSHLGLDAPGGGARARLERVAAALAPGRRLQVGAERARHADHVLAAVLAVARAGGPVMATVQANLRCAGADARALADAGVPIRLVKGAYPETPDLAHPRGEATDLAYLELAHELAGAGAEVALATHDPVLREAVLRAYPGLAVEMLLGVRAADARALAARGVPVRVYAPYGPAWFRYAMRRLAESRV